MIELLSIACISIASKVDEVFIHSLDDYQVCIRNSEMYVTQKNRSNFMYSS